MLVSKTVLKKNARVFQQAYRRFDTLLFLQTRLGFARDDGKGKDRTKY